MYFKMVINFIKLLHFKNDFLKINYWMIILFILKMIILNIIKYWHFEDDNIIIFKDDNIKYY
jgi:hypothetical protein